MTLPTKAKDLTKRLLNEADLMAVHPQRIPDRTLAVLREAAAVIAEMGEALATQTRLAEGNFAAREEAVQRARDRAEALEAAERRLAAIHDRAMSICEQYHADIDQPAARHAYALALHDIAALSTPQPASEGKKS